MSAWRQIVNKASLCDLPFDKRWHDGDVSLSVDSVIAVGASIEASLELFDVGNMQEYASYRGEALDMIREHPIGYRAKCGCFTLRERWL
jgi:hypothetical protein